jgi:hypothetical protein
MKRVTRFTTLAAVSIVLTIGTAVGAVVTHAIGASPSDVRAIEAAVTEMRHGEPASIDWYIAVDGPYASAIDGCGPGACNENQLVRQGGRWIVTCYTTEGKGCFGTCLMPLKTEEKLRREALCMAMSSVDGISCTTRDKTSSNSPTIRDSSDAQSP